MFNFNYIVCQLCALWKNARGSLWRQTLPLLWRHNGHDGVSNHQPHHCLLNGTFRRRSKKTPKLRVTGLCAGKSPVVGESPAQMASNAENINIWWRHHAHMRVHLPLNGQNLDQTGIKIWPIILTSTLHKFIFVFCICFLHFKTGYQ